MIEFFTFPLQVSILITFTLGLCVLSQTLALVLCFYRSRLNTQLVWRHLLEASILYQILFFSLMHGQIVNGYKCGFVVATGYESSRIFGFIVTLVLIGLVCVSSRKYLPLSIIPFVMISLPIIEDLLGPAFPWVYMSALIFFLQRSIRICVACMIGIKTSISALSVKRAIDTMNTGVLFCQEDGHILLSNKVMQHLMFTITGKVYRNAIDFFDVLLSDDYKARYKKTELEGQSVYILTDDTAWMLTKTNILLGKKKYIHISIGDVTKLWTLTAKLKDKDKELRQKSNELKKIITNLHVRSKEKEIQNAKMRVHDILGQRLSVLLRIIQNEQNPDYGLLTSLLKGLLAELKAEKNEIGPYDEIENIKQIFHTIGVDIDFYGQLPQDSDQASLFVDIIREGATNAVRHSLATQISISIDADLLDNTYTVTIKNNGYLTNSPITPGGGISRMKKRVDAYGGELKIIQSPVFTLSAEIPRGE